MKKLIFITVFTIVHTLLFSQGKYDLNIPDFKNYYSTCGHCADILDSKPENIMMTVEVDAARNIYFIINNAEWFWSLMEVSTDAIAADIVLRNNFDCNSTADNNNFYLSNSIFLTPLYVSDLKERSISSTNGKLRINMGTLPPNISKNNYEINIVFINKCNS